MQPTRTRDERRAARLPVISRALALFRTRKTNIGRRNPSSAKVMRFAGEEARFCLATARDHIASEQFQAAVERKRRERLAAIPAEERSARISAIHDELELLDYRPLSVDIGARGRELRAELAELGYVADVEAEQVAA